MRLKKYRNQNVSLFHYVGHWVIEGDEIGVEEEVGRMLLTLIRFFSQSFFLFPYTWLKTPKPGFPKHDYFANKIHVLEYRMCYATWSKKADHDWAISTAAQNWIIGVLNKVSEMGHQAVCVQVWLKSHVFPALQRAWAMVAQIGLLQAFCSSESLALQSWLSYLNSYLHSAFIGDSTNNGDGSFLDFCTESKEYIPRKLP